MLEINVLHVQLLFITTNFVDKNSFRFKIRSGTGDK